MKHDNVNNIFFNGTYKDIWRNIFPEQITEAEISYIKSFLTSKNATIIDLMCGYGRHTVPLARDSYKLVSIDNLDAYISEINTISLLENLNIHSICSDILLIDYGSNADLIIWMGNNISFFDKSDLNIILKKARSALKIEGYLIINMWTIAEIVFKNFSPRDWNNYVEYMMISENHFKLNPSRIESENKIFKGTNFVETKSSIDYIYSLNEISEAIIQQGFQIKNFWSIPGKKPYTLGEPRLYLEACAI